jgi:hypothetical protein
VIWNSGCSCDGETGTDDGGRPEDAGGDIDGRIGRDDGGGAPMDAEVDGDGGGVPMDAEVDGDSGGTGACVPATCAGRTYQCGDCIDNDGDGLIDSRDPGCIGPCDNTESRYDLGIPGGDTATCRRDCYYDQDQGSGNDGCSYDQRCDPLAPDPRCPYTPPGGSVSCPDTQPARCQEVCGPLVPNGCDCFGCCELPAGSGRYVFLGSPDATGERTCSPDSVDDPTRCRPCTPYRPCLNECGPCELCFGRTELPPECFPPPDGGVLRDDAGNPIDGGTPPPRCAPGVQPCGLPGDPACPEGWYCLTGCCIYYFG